MKIRKREKFKVQQAKVVRQFKSWFLPAFIHIFSAGEVVVAFVLSVISIFQLKQDRVPFAVIGSNAVVECQGKKVRGRAYPWGIVEGQFQSVSSGT